ncbi:hypothetical protein LAUMK13_02883 [Mycobacterium innocens]|uniref:Uncharacterized protein n=1 Tax=Mycobacterium innocens TaxID=2341083 RepID=A0A498Q560_9MYCO|nr:hypothetical protein LAUMK13_02883 [Mycobacterium innocens]
MIAATFRPLTTTNLLGGGFHRFTFDAVRTGGLEDYVA